MLRTWSWVGVKLLSWFTGGQNGPNGWIFTNWFEQIHSKFISMNKGVNQVPTKNDHSAFQNNLACCADRHKHLWLVFFGCETRTESFQNSYEVTFLSISGWEEDVQSRCHSRHIWSHLLIPGVNRSAYNWRNMNVNTRSKQGLCACFQLPFTWRRTPSENDAGTDDGWMNSCLISVFYL